MNATHSPPEAAELHFRHELAPLRSRERATRERAYLKSELTFMGVGVPDMRRISRGYLKQHPHLSRAELIAIVTRFFATDIHELRMCAIRLLEFRANLLSSEDLPWLVGLVRQSAGWAYVDALAANVIGAVIAAAPETREQLRVWATDRDFWVRRTALLAQLIPLRKGGGDFALFADIAVPMLSEKEFFIRKAIGWVLRDTSRRRPSLVRDFFAEHGDAASGLTRREGLKYIGELLPGASSEARRGGSRRPRARR